jgi:secreted trypsin-like serine protease
VGADIGGVIPLVRAMATAVLVAATAMPSAAGAQNRASGAPTMPPSAHAAVIGGQPATPGTFPWMAYVLDVRGRELGQCTGTVVAANLVLTAGHCAENEQTGVVNEASGYRVLTGNVNAGAAEAERQASAVTRVIVCSCHDRHTAVGDVALLQLSTPTTAPAVTLAARPGNGTEALLAGWGDTYPGEGTLVERLRSAPTAVQSAGWCEREAPPFSPASEICAIDSPAHRTGACSGDSGGPLLVAEPAAPGGMVQVGVASHVYSECSTTRPSVFTRVDAVSSWVKGWAQALASGPPAATALPAGLVAAPTLPGLASSRSISLRNGGISLVLACDGEGGVCAGDAEASITVRERHIVRSGGRLSVSSARTFRATLAKVEFAIAPGASTVVSSELSPQSRALLSRLGRGPLDVVLSGQGIARHVIALEPAGHG